MRRLPLAMLVSVLLVGSLTGCQGKKPDPGDVAGYDEGEQYLSIWVHSIEDTDEGKCYRESVEAFNEKYNGTYYADIEFIPRNDSGGGYSDKINASVMSGDLPDVLTVDGPNIAAYASNGMIQPLAELTEEEKDVYPFFRPENRDGSRKCAVVSASPDFLIREICERMKVDYCIATRHDERTGKLLGSVGSRRWRG